MTGLFPWDLEEAPDLDKSLSHEISLCCGEAASEIPAPSLCPIFTAFISCKFIESCYPVITVSEHHCQFDIRDILH